MNKSNESFGDNLRREIRRKHLKYADAAELLDISLGFLNKMMNGESTPSLEMLYKILRKLEISADALMFGDSRPVYNQDIDPASFTSVAQIAAAMTELNAKFDKLTKTSEHETNVTTLKPAHQQPINDPRVTAALTKLRTRLSEERIMTREEIAEYTKIPDFLNDTKKKSDEDVG